jgi:ABC-2 type transport system ATP-binding protein
MNVIETRKLTRLFGQKEAVSGLDLAVESGNIYALLGPNGAGKTTTLKTLMNILSPTSGQARVLDVDSRRLSPREFAQIGYVSENQEMPEWMKVGEFLEYCKTFYPTWDKTFAENLTKQFALDPTQKLKNLSRGTRMKAALVSSLAYRPKLLVLDEPFNGLDPLIREEFIQGILELTDQEQWTVLISSHDVDEVEKLADWVGVLNQGKLFLSEPLEGLQARFRRMAVRLPESSVLPHSLPPSWMEIKKEGMALQFVESAYKEGAAEKEINRLLPGSQSVTATPLSLREIFVVLARNFRMSNEGGMS